MSDRKTTDPWVNIATWYLRQMASRISYFSVFNVLVTFEFGIFTKTLFRKNFDQIKKINAGKTSYEISVLSSNWIFFYTHSTYLNICYIFRNTLTPHAILRNCYISRCFLYKTLSILFRSKCLRSISPLTWKK